MKTLLTAITIVLATTTVHAEVIRLLCVPDDRDTTLSKPIIEIDTARNTVTKNGKDEPGVKISDSSIIFYQYMDGKAHKHTINRVDGSMLVLQLDPQMRMSFQCKKATTNAF